MPNKSKHPRVHQLALRVDDDERQWVEREAERLGVDLSDVLRMALHEARERRAVEAKKEARRASA